MALDFGIGDIISAGINMYSANTTAQKNIDWEKEKAQNYHQWEMEDYRKAGINPILTTGGHPTLGGANAQMPDTSGLGRAFEKALTAKKIENETKVANAEVENKNKDTELKEVQKENVATDTALKTGQTDLTAESTKKTAAEAKIKQEQALREKERLENEINILQQEAEQAKTNTEKNEIEKEIKRKENKWFHVNQVLSGIGKISGLGFGIYGGATAVRLTDAITKQKNNIKNNIKKFTRSNKESQEVINYRKKYLNPK